MSWPLERFERLARLGRRAVQSVHPLLWAADGVQDLADGQHHALFEAWCAAHPGSACHIHISGELLLDVLPEPGTPAQSGAARLQWAQRILAHYHGPQAAAWPLLAWPAAGRGALGVSAWRGADQAALRASASPHGVTLRGLSPLWPALLQRLLQARPALARAPAALAVWVEGSCASLATLRRGQLVNLQRRRLPMAPAGEPAGEGALSTLRRLVDDTLQGAPWPVAMLWLGAGAPASGPTHGLDLAVVLPLAELAQPASSTAALRWPARQVAPRLDFARPLPQPGVLAWAACAACLAVLAAAAVEAHAAYKLLAAAEQLAPPRTRPAPATVGPRPSDVRRAESAQWLAQAAHPWSRVMQASERASLPGVTWQLLEHEAGGELRLRGRSAQPGQARAVAAALRRQGPWREVWVVRQELRDDSDRSGVENFEIVARAAEPRP